MRPGRALRGGVCLLPTGRKRGGRRPDRADRRDQRSRQPSRAGIPGRTRGGGDQPYRGRAHRRRAAQQRSAGRGVRRDAGDGSHSGSLVASWAQPTGKARQSEILIRQLLAEAGASGISPELVSIDDAARGDWTIGDQAAVLHDVNGWIVFRFHARDLRLVMGPAARGDSVRFRVLIDGQLPGAAHGTDADENGVRNAGRPAALSAHPSA